MTSFGIDLLDSLFFSVKTKYYMHKIHQIEYNYGVEIIDSGYNVTKKQNITQDCVCIYYCLVSSLERV